MSVFNIEQDPIPSFAALQQERAKVFESRDTLSSFARTVDELGRTDEPGRRRGLGLWLIASFEACVELLAGYPTDDVASFTRANALMSLGRPADAQPIFERLSQAYPDEPRPRGALLEAKLEADILSVGDEQALMNLEQGLDGAPPSFQDSAEAHYLLGRRAELARDWQAAIDCFRAAREVDPTHRANLFHLAYRAERTGLEDLALEAYESLASMLPTDHNVLMNLGVLYEDLGRDQDAAACFDTVVRSQPTNRRARLYFEDARAGMSMFYDEDMEKKEDRLNQILRIPITDFELSVRARNCLNKMGIMSLGDLVKKTEAELLSYKNFGETSLNEIKEILGSKGLRLGMAREEAVASIAKARTDPGAGFTGTPDQNDLMTHSLSELKLSIRARRTVENLGCLTIADVVQHSENELLGMPNFGVTSLLELKAKLSDLSLSLKAD
ncbi:MAG: DNA-directed RNA polymerase subunit alpha [Chlamydiales bacterium]